MHDLSAGYDVGGSCRFSSYRESPCRTNRIHHGSTIFREQPERPVNFPVSLADLTDESFVRIAGSWFVQ